MIIFLGADYGNEASDGTSTIVLTIDPGSTAVTLLKAPVQEDYGLEAEYHVYPPTRWEQRMRRALETNDIDTGLAQALNLGRRLNCGHGRGGSAIINHRRP